jgi:glycosyltransferase involved in cell wall biosynthesis
LSPMRICIVVDDYWPDSVKVTAKMMHELAVEFVQTGHSVTVITPGVGNTQALTVSTLEGVTVCRFRSPKIKNTSMAKRLVNEFLLPYRAWAYGHQHFKAHPHDLIVYWSPSIFWTFLIKRLKSSWGAPAYMLLRDFFPQWVVDNGMLKEGSPITRFFRFFEKLNYEAADVIALQSPKNIEWFASTKRTHTPLTLLYNWAKDKPIKTPTGLYRDRLGLNGKVVFFYGGNIGHAQDMMNIVNLARQLKDHPMAHLLLVGRGDEYALVESAIAQESLQNITLLPSVTQDEFELMLSEFDVGLFSLHRDHSSHNFPGKLLAYMVQGLPILGSVNQGNDLKEVIESAGAGCVTVNGDDKGLLQNAIRLLDDDVRLKMGLQSKKLLKQTFSVSQTVSNILTYFKI